MIGENALLEPFFYVVLAGVLVCYFLFRRARHSAPRPIRPKHDLAYECIAESAGKATARFREKFPNGATFLKEPDVHLLRFGLFNIGFEAIKTAHFRRPITVKFSDDTGVLAANYAESLSTAYAVQDPIVEDSALQFLPFEIEGGGTVIFNIILRGSPKIERIESDIENIDVIRRLG